MLKHCYLFCYLISILWLFLIFFFFLIIAHRLLCCVTFPFGVVTESSSNEYPLPPSSSLGCQHFWEGEREALALSCHVVLVWHEILWHVTLKKRSLWQPDMGNASILFTTAGKWMTNHAISATKNKKYFPFPLYFIQFYDLVEFSNCGAPPASLQFSHFFLMGFSQLQWGLFCLFLKDLFNLLMIYIFLLTTLPRQRSKTAFLVLCFKFKRGRKK